MSLDPKYVFSASMDVDPERDELFNEVYDQEHIPSLDGIPGVVRTTRFRREPFELAIGGETKRMDLSGEPLYVTLYELETPEVLTSPEWARAIESGRWPSEVRPYTRNRKHSLLRRI